MTILRSDGNYNKIHSLTALCEPYNPVQHLALHREKGETLIMRNEVHKPPITCPWVVTREPWQVQARPFNRKSEDNVMSTKAAGYLNFSIDLRSSPRDSMYHSWNSLIPVSEKPETLAMSSSRSKNTTSCYACHFCHQPREISSSIWTPSY